MGAEERHIAPDRGRESGDPGYLDPDPRVMNPQRADRAGEQAVIDGRVHLDPIGAATPAADSFGGMSRPTEEANGEINPGGLDTFPVQPDNAHGAKRPEGRRTNRG